MTWLLQILLPLFASTAEAEAKKWLQKFMDDNKAIATQILLAFYPIIDVQLEKFALESKTKVDDDIVRRLKRVLEEVAEDNGIELPNLDAGLPGD